MGQDNQIDVARRAMEKMREIIYYQTNVEWGSGIHDDNALLRNEVGVRHRKTISDRMHPAGLLGKGR